MSGAPNGRVANSDSSAGYMDVGAVAAAAATGVQVGVATVLSRLVVEQTGAVPLAFWRYVFGLAFLAIPALIFARGVRLNPRDRLPMAALGVTQFGLSIVFLNVGLAYVSAARAALVFACLPLLTLVIAHLAGHARLTPRRTLAVLLSVIGVALALSERRLAPAAPAHTDLPPGIGAWIGEAAVLTSALCGAWCSVMYRPYLARYPAIAVGAQAMLASVVFLGLWCLLTQPSAFLPSLPTVGWVAIIAIGLSSGVGYFLWLWALARAPASEVTMYLSLSPIVAAWLGAWWLDEPAGWPTLAGMALVILALWTARKN